VKAFDAEEEMEA